MFPLLRYTAAMIGVLACGSALAQVDMPPDILIVQPTLRASYDDNRLKLSKERAPGDRDDFVFTPSIDFTIRKLIGGRHQATLTGFAGYDIHRDFKFLDRERIEATGEVNFQVAGSCQVRPGAAVNWAQANLSDQGFIVGNTLRQTDLEITIACRRAAGLYPTATGRISRATNSAQSRDIFNLHNDFASAGIGYRVPSIGDLVASVEYERFERPKLRSRLGIDDRTETMRYGLLFTRDVAPRVSFRASANYFRVNPRSPNWSNFSGFGFRAGVSVRPSPALSFNFDGSRSATSQGNIGTTYIIETDWRLSAKYKASARTDFQLGGRLRHRNFQGELMIDTPIARDFDRTAQVNIGVTRAINRRIQAGISARHERRTANVSFYEYRSTSVTAQIGVRL